jgi:ATP-binding protein involved in chromosome partitioning
VSLLGARSPVDTGVVRAAVEAVVEPQLGLPLGELGLVADVLVDRRGVVRCRLHAVSVDPAPAQRLRARVQGAVSGLPHVSRVEVELGDMDGAQRQELGNRLRRRHRRPGTLGDTTAVYAVGSGKGGVGKSTVTANLAAALALAGRRVGVLDADVWGYSVPQLFGVREAPAAVRGMMLPLEARGVQLMSVGFFVSDEEPVVWRGPMLHKALEQFLDDVYWGDLDVLLVDLPPGTGDVTLSVLELLPDAALLVTTTPQVAAEQVAARVGRMARDSRMPVAGVVENMTGGVFGSGGGQRLATAIDAPLLGQVPLDAALCAAGDVGVPLVLSDPDAASARELSRVAATLPVVRRSLVGRPLPLTPT